MTSLSNWSCLLISVPKVHWRVHATDCCQTERQIQQDASSSVCIARVSQKCLHENCPPVLEKEQCPPITEISSLGSDAQSYVETFIQIPKQFLNRKLHWRRYGTIFASQLIKLSRVLQIVWQEYVNGDGIHSKHLFLLKKLFALLAFALSWIVKTIFNNVSTAKLPWLKAA